MSTRTGRKTTKSILPLILSIPFAIAAMLVLGLLPAIVHTAYADSGDKTTRFEMVLDTADFVGPEQLWGNVYQISSLGETAVMTDTTRFTGDGTVLNPATSGTNASLVGDLTSANYALKADFNGKAHWCGPIKVDGAVLTLNWSTACKGTDAKGSKASQGNTAGAKPKPKMIRVDPTYVIANMDTDHAMERFKVKGLSYLLRGAFPSEATAYMLVPAIRTTSAGKLRWITNQQMSHKVADGMDPKPTWQPLPVNDTDVIKMPTGVWDVYMRVMPDNKELYVARHIAELLPSDKPAKDFSFTGDKAEKYPVLQTIPDSGGVFAVNSKQLGFLLGLLGLLGGTGLVLGIRRRKPQPVTA